MTRSFFWNIARLVEASSFGFLFVIGVSAGPVTVRELSGTTGRVGNRDDVGVA